MRFLRRRQPPGTTTDLPSELVEPMLSQGQKLRTDPRKRALAINERADAAGADGMHELAIRLYRISLDSVGDQAPVLYNIGNNYLRLDRPQEAIEAYTDALKLDPHFAYALMNRGIALVKVDRDRSALDDLLAALSLGCTLPNLVAPLVRTFVRVHSFEAFYDFLRASEHSDEARQFLVDALQEALIALPTFDAGIIAGAFALANGRGGHPSGPDPARLQLDCLVRMADVLRECPIDNLGGIRAARSHTGLYEATRVNTDDLPDQFWYRPTSWAPEDPEPRREDHLDRLAQAAADAEKAGDLVSAWRALYMCGALLLSSVFAERRDWPDLVSRLSVAYRRDGAGRGRPIEDAVEKVDAWVLRTATDPLPHGREARLAGHAANTFARAASMVLQLRLAARDPLPDDIVPESVTTQAAIIQQLRLHQALPEEARGNDALIEQWIAEHGASIEVDPASVTPLTLAQTQATQAWAIVDPLFREWAVAGHLAGRADQAVAVAAARRLNALVALDLWSGVPAPAWRSCRDRVSAAYEPRGRAGADALPAETALLDYYIYELVVDYVLRTVTHDGQQRLSELALDPLAGDIRLLMAAHLQHEMPAAGLVERLDEILVHGLEPLLRDCTRLVIAPFGYLRNIPFHAMTTVRGALEQGPLTEIAYLPSPTFLPRLLERAVTPVARRRCLVVGFDPSGEIDVGSDVKSVRAAFPKADELLGNDATLANVLEALGSYDLIHFACHGDINDALAAGYLELADGRLYPWDIMSSDSRVPETIVMNACLSGATRRFGPTADEAVGLHTAFLIGGARQVIGGLWPINEWSAQRFNESFYAALAAGASTAACAVADAQANLRAASADPWLWAPHVLFGDWR